MKIAVIYDCLYPHTVGGAEHWYREVCERLGRHHDVTYVTRRQWGRGEEPDAPAGVPVIAVSGGLELYTASGRRKIGVPLRFGWGVFWHLLRHRRDYDVVHTCAFPYFSLIAARAAGAFGGFRVIVDWHEVWTAAYWREYLGPLGRVGHAVQRLCVRLSQRAFTFSRLHARRLHEEGIRSEPVVLPGEYWGHSNGPIPLSEPSSRVLFAGRMIREKRAGSVPPAVARARETDPSIGAVLAGDGPERERVLRLVSELGLADAIELPGLHRPRATAAADARRALPRAALRARGLRRRRDRGGVGRHAIDRHRRPRQRGGRAHRPGPERDRRRLGRSR